MKENENKHGHGVAILWHLLLTVANKFQSALADCEWQIGTNDCNDSIWQNGRVRDWILFWFLVRLNEKHLKLVKPKVETVDWIQCNGTLNRWWFHLNNILIACYDDDDDDDDRCFSRFALLLVKPNEKKKKNYNLLNSKPSAGRIASNSDSKRNKTTNERTKEWKRRKTKNEKKHGSMCLLPAPIKRSLILCISYFLSSVLWWVRLHATLGV